MVIVYIDSNTFISAKRRKEKNQHQFSKKFMDYVTKLNDKKSDISFFLHLDILELN